MKPNTRTRTVESTITGEAVELTLDASATAHLMSMFTDAYADPELATIREYATNALDAHVAAGNSAPIEVETPTALRPTLVVRDFGTGLDADDIRQVYSQYGASTKRGTNDATGMLGIGCKSALSYTDQFTVTGTKDGVRTTVSVARAESGGGSMTILSQDETDAPNGVEIQVPAPRSNELAEKAETLFSYWEPGTVLLNGETPRHVQDDERHVRVTDSVLARPDRIARTSYSHAQVEDIIVQGGVPYPTDFGIDGVSLVAWVPIGSVDFPPSREALMDTRRTRDTVAAVTASYHEHKGTAIQRAMDAADDKADALRIWSEASWMGTNGTTVTFKGTELPTSFNNGEDGAHLVLVGQGENRWSRRTQGLHVRLPSIEVEKAAKAPCWVTGFTNSNFTGPMREKLDGYLAEKLGEDAPDAKGAILTPLAAVPSPEWIDVPVYDWSDIRKFKLDPSTRPVSRHVVRGTYPCWLPPTDGRVDYRDKYPAADICRVRLFVKEGGKYEGRETAAQIHASYPDATLVVVNANRIAKFKRDFPEAVDAAEGLKQAALGWWKALDADTRTLVTYDTDGCEDAVMELGLDPDALSDGALRSRIDFLTRKGNLNGEVSAYARHFRWLDRAEIQAAAELAGDPSVIESYPLLTAVELPYGRHDRDGTAKRKLIEELTLYANAAYAARQ